MSGWRGYSEAQWGRLGAAVQGPPRRLVGILRKPSQHGTPQLAFVVFLSCMALLGSFASRRPASEDHSMKTIGIGLTLAVASTGIANAQDLLVNGGLEGSTPSACAGFTTLSGGSTAITGWRVVGPRSIDWAWHNPASAGGCCDSALQGNRFIDLNGSPAQDGGAIEQTVPTSAGHRYRIVLRALANGCCSPMGTAKTMRITTENAQSEHTLLTLWGSADAGVECDWSQWSMIEHEWTATGNTTVVELRSLVLGNAGGILIDDISVTEVSACPGDLDNSNSVTGVDLAIVLTNWNAPNPKYPEADVNGDGAVDGADLAIVLSNWGDCP